MNINEFSEIVHIQAFLWIFMKQKETIYEKNK